MKLGCDPEIFLVDAAGAFRSAVGKIGGSKSRPRPLPLGEGYAVQEDNVAIEFNTPPAEAREQFISSVGNTVAFLADAINELYGLRLSPVSAAIFEETELATPEAQQFGCDPDFNVWTGQVNPKPKASDMRLRSCGGHVHIGTDINSIEQANQLGKLCDLFLGVGATLMDNGEMRKQLYGKMGAVRYKPYGLEYRVLSNFWIFDPKLRGWVWDNTELALAHMDLDVNPLQERMEAAINFNNKDMAMSLVKEYNIPLL